MRYIVTIAGMLLAANANADLLTIGPDGIDSAATGLNGDSVLIGQAEPGRSGKDNRDSASLSAAGTEPAGVYFRTSGGQDPVDSSHITEHATVVAGIAIGQNGVATGGQLHSAAYGEGGNAVDAALTLNRLATLGGGNVRATNMSFGIPLGSFENPDGSSHLTSFIDWSARVHDLLYVAALADNFSEQPASPDDNLNGITVAASERRENESSWRKFGSINSIEGLGSDDTINVHILAPGHEVSALGFNSIPVIGDGTSLAAPHVTGAVALLQQYANNNFAGNPNSRRHEVMKALMMNSADKISGVQGSNRTVLDSNDMDWQQSEAYLNPSIPLDDQMGAGHLNVRRAVEQFAPGEQNPGSVRLLGWDFGSYSGQGQQAEYVLNGSVGADQYVTITVVWDRFVDSTATCGAGTYCEGDQFFSTGFADLNVALVRADGTTLRTSVSDSTNFEHIFYKTSGAEDLKIVVSRLGFDGPISGNFALAWWAGTGASPLPGDFNRDGTVDTDDYTVWKTNFGTGFADADGNEDGIVDAADYTIWRDNLGAGSGSAAVVPETSAAWLLASVLACLWGRRGFRVQQLVEKL